MDFGFWILDFGFWILDFVTRFGPYIRLEYWSRRPGSDFRLEALPSFIQKGSNASLILQNWCHHKRPCCRQGGFACFQVEAKMFQGAESDRIAHSSQAYFEWVSDVTNMVKNSTLSLPHYYETNIFMRNLKSKYSGNWKTAFNEVFKKNREVPRDQPLLPVFLEKHGLNAEIITVRKHELDRELGWRFARKRATRATSNLDVG